MEGQGQKSLFRSDVKVKVEGHMPGAYTHSGRYYGLGLPSAAKGWPLPVRHIDIRRISVLHLIMEGI